jgi:hypothetical protein
MNAHKVETVLAEDGILTIRGLPFRAGDYVEAIVIEGAKATGNKTSVDCQVYLQSISLGMNEWESEADELAYQNL